MIGIEPYTIREALTRVPVSATFRTKQLVERLEARGEKVFNLGLGEAPFPVHPRIVEALRASAHENHYRPAQGLARLREAVSLFFEEEFSLCIPPERVLIGPGSKELIYACIATLRGDVLIPAPAWVSYAPQCHLAGKLPIRIPLSFEDGYRLSAEALESAIHTAREEGRDPKILILTYPNNPTGLTMDEDALAAIAHTARTHGIMIISDEIYALTTYARRHVSIARFYPEGTIVTSGPSKDRALGGYRLGAALLPGGGLIDALVAYASETWSCVADPLQHAGIVAYRDGDVRAQMHLCTQIHAATTTYLARRLNEAGYACHMPEGAFYAFASLRDDMGLHGIGSGQDLADELLGSYRVAVIAGEEFGLEKFSFRASAVCYDGAVALEAFRSGLRGSRLVEHACPDLVEACNRLGRFASKLKIRVPVR